MISPVQVYRYLKHKLLHQRKQEPTNSIDVSPGFIDFTNGIVPYPDGTSPTQLWDRLRIDQVVKDVTPLALDTPIHKDKVRFVCMSDTHNTTSKLPFVVPKGDVFLHAGDFTHKGQPWEIEKFNDFLGKLDHTYKIVIAGNHDLSFHREKLEETPYTWYNYFFGSDAQKFKDYVASKGVQYASDLLTNCIYLEDSEVTVFGLRIYGSPWQPTYGDWAFTLERGQACLDKWNFIPEGVDILMTHGPPLGRGDCCFPNRRAGCAELLSTVQHRVHPKYHIFGHIHEGYGITTDGHTNYINASTCTRSVTYNPGNPPVIFDIPLPENTNKQQFIDSK